MHFAFQTLRHSILLSFWSFSCLSSPVDSFTTPASAEPKPWETSSVGIPEDWLCLIPRDKSSVCHGTEISKCSSTFTFLTARHLLNQEVLKPLPFVGGWGVGPLSVLMHSIILFVYTPVAIVYNLVFILNTWFETCFKIVITRDIPVIHDPILSGH